MKYLERFDTIATIGFLKRTDGSDLANEGHKLQKSDPTFGNIYKFLKKHDESKVDFLSRIHYVPSKLDYWFGSW